MVRNSPWAMLITPIWPKMIARPRAINSSTQNTDSPLKPCMAAMAPNSDSHSIRSLLSEERHRLQAAGPSGCLPPALPLLVALRDGIGFDQVGLVDQGELTVGQDFADAGLAPQVLVLVHFHVAFRRGVQLDPGAGGNHLVHIEAAGLLDGGLPQPRAEVGSLGHVTDYRVLAQLGH